MENKTNNNDVFKYNMSLYYQSLIIYFLVFILYVLVRGQFVGGAFKLVFDPIIYFFLLILVVAFLSVVYNLFLNRKLIVDNTSISFVNRKRTRIYLISDITMIHIAKEITYLYSNPFKLIRVKFNNKRRPLIIRPNDYENEAELINIFASLKEKLENKNV